MEGKIYKPRSNRLLGVKGIPCSNCTNDKVFKKRLFYQCTKCKTLMPIPEEPKELTENVEA
jgi:DNA replicative helicase MCM subunit Mcm2 (Cdc46/Mcm family)